MHLAYIVVIVLGCVLGWVYVFQERMVFFPNEEMLGDPSHVGLVYEDLNIVTEDDVALHAWHVPYEEDPRGTILFCHGNAGNISGRLDTLLLLHGLGFNVVLFDYRGYGRSEGRPTEDGVNRDAEAVWRYVTGELGEAPERVVIQGRSLGGAVAARLARSHRPGALILESTFTSMPDVGRRVYPYLPGFVARLRFDTLSLLSDISCPLLVAHSKQDDLVPYEFGRKLFMAYQGPKRFMKLRGGHGNGFLVTGSDYVRGLDGFLRDLAGL